MKVVKKGFTLLELVCVMAIMGFLFIAILSMTTPSQKIHRKTSVNENTYAIADNVQQYIQRNLDYADTAWVFTSNEDERANNLEKTVEEFRKCYYKNVVMADKSGGDIKSGFVKGKIHVLQLINNPKDSDQGQIRHYEVNFKSDSPIASLGSSELVLNPAYFEGDNANYHITYALNSSELVALSETNRNGDAFVYLKSEKDEEPVRQSVVGQSLSIIVNRGVKDTNTQPYTKFEGPAIISIANIPFSNICAKMSLSDEGDSMYGSGCAKRTVQESLSGDVYYQGTISTPADLNYEIPGYLKAIDHKDGNIPHAFCNLVTDKVSTKNDIFYVYAYASDLVKY